ncbi:MAG TPA: acyl-CoA dehydrogenase [Mesorhizobium sp.]|jgi:hypothetical protein|nr:acyl-CoA dehydrogenase [Mesorhizobium sp.]
MYQAPVGEISFTLKHVAGLKEAIDSGRLNGLSEDVVDAVLEEAGRFASTAIAPLNLPGDLEGARWEDGRVSMPAGWAALYRQWTEAGWNSLSAPEEFGGQGLPTLMSVAALEMWNSASMAFGLGPTLTMGAIEALVAHASPELQQRYLPKLVSGEWMGTMNLTEPQAGSDLGALTTRAEPQADGTYRLFGQKIFITYGEHDMAENIVHLVLARMTDAPQGTKGISLFLVPKFLSDEEGDPGKRNDVFCLRLEEKLGIHASPTCTMLFGGGKGETAEPGAVGWLVGEPNRGLNAMFTMMNNARLAVGMQGVAVAEAATQAATAYAAERRQGRHASLSDGGMAPILRHPDVQRNLLTMRGLTGAVRAIAYACAHAIDMAHATGGDEAKHWAMRAGLLTPVAKAFSTDVGVEVASLGIQVHGGMGYVEETGAAIFYRDARIAPIYEGTNGIQAIDLVTRKLPLDEGRHVHGFIGELRAVVDEVRTSNREGFGRTADELDRALDALQAATDFLQKALAEGRADEALAGATPYQRLFGLASGGVLLAKGALASDEVFRVTLCRFYAENLVGEAAALDARVRGGAESLEAAAESVLFPA